MNVSKSGYTSCVVKIFQTLTMATRTKDKEALVFRAFGFIEASRVRAQIVCNTTPARMILPIEKHRMACSNPWRNYRLSYSVARKDPASSQLKYGLRWTSFASTCRSPCGASDGSMEGICFITTHPYGGRRATAMIRAPSSATSLVWANGEALLRRLGKPTAVSSGQWTQSFLHNPCQHLLARAFW